MTLLRGVDVPTKLNGMPYVPAFEKSGCNLADSPIAAMKVADCGSTGSRSTRWFQTSLAGKIAHALSGGNGAGLGRVVAAGAGGTVDLGFGLGVGEG